MQLFSHLVYLWTFPASFWSSYSIRLADRMAEKASKLPIFDYRTSREVLSANVFRRKCVECRGLEPFQPWSDDWDVISALCQLSF